MKKKLILVSIVAPVFNEEKSIEAFVDRIYTTCNKISNFYQFELILVDDGSKDKSLEILKKITKRTGLRIIELRKNYGQTAALQAGLDYALGEIIITMDSDLQHFPEEIPSFLEKIQSGYDVVCGWRKSRKEGVIRRWPSKAANYLIRKITGIKVNDVGTTYRAYRTEIVRDFKLYGDSHRFVPVFAEWVGAKITEIPITNIERPEGNSNYGISRTFKVFLDLFFLYFLVNFFDKPVRLFGFLAAVLASFSLIIITSLVFVSFLEGISTFKEHPGWFVISIFFAITAVQLILTGVIAEILTRLSFKTGASSSYHIRNVWESGNT